MRHAKTLIILGTLVIFVPFLGMPSSWQHIIFVLLGASIIAATYRIVLIYKSSSTHTTKANPVVYSTEDVFSGDSEKEDIDILVKQHEENSTKDTIA